MIDGTASAYFDPLVSYPFVPGHEVVATTERGRRVALVPVLSCVTRASTRCAAQCAARRTNLCERVAFGHLEPGLQSGFCTDTGGGWSTWMVAHTSQLVDVPDDLSDEAAVMIEPTACAAHAALRYHGHETVIIGAGTVGLLDAGGDHRDPRQGSQRPVDRHGALRRAAQAGEGARRRHRVHARRAAAVGPFDDQVDGARRPVDLGLPQRRRLRRIRANR